MSPMKIRKKDNEPDDNDDEKLDPVTERAMRRRAADKERKARRRGQFVSEWINRHGQKVKLITYPGLPSRRDRRDAIGAPGTRRMPLSHEPDEEVFGYGEDGRFTRPSRGKKRGINRRRNKTARASRKRNRR